MKAVGTYIIVKDEPLEQTNSLGHLITERSDNKIRYITGEVVSVGGEVKEIKPGDVVYFDKVAGSSFRYQSDRYKAIRERDVVVTI